MDGDKNHGDKDFVTDSSDWDAVTGQASTASIQRHLEGIFREGLRRIAVPLTQLCLAATALVIWLTWPVLFPEILRHHSEVVTLILLLACAITVIRGSLRSWVMPAVVITVVALAWLLGMDVPIIWYQWGAFLSLIGIIAFALTPNFH